MLAGVKARRRSPFSSEVDKNITTKKTAPRRGSGLQDVQNSQDFLNSCGISLSKLLNVTKTKVCRALVGLADDLELRGHGCSLDLGHPELKLEMLFFDLSKCGNSEWCILG